MTSVAPLARGEADQPAAEAAAGNTAHEPRGARLSLGTLGFYGAGAMVENVTTFGLSNLLLFYLTIICGLSGAEAGMALGATLVADSTIDPLVGSLSDNWRSRHGRRHPWMLASVPAIIVSFGLLFSIPAGLKGIGLFAYALAALLAARMALSCFIVPYTALGAELSDDYSERSTIVASRLLFTVLAGTAAAFLAYGVFMKGPEGQTHRDAYAPFAWSCGVIVVIGALASTFGTLRARDRLHAAPAGQGSGLSRFGAEVVEVFRNRSFRWLFITCLIFFVASGAAGALSLHASTYFWKLQTHQILIVSLSSTAGIFVGVFAAALLSKLMEKRTLAMVGLAIIGLCQFFPVALRLTGVIGPEAAVPVLATATLLAGVGASAALIGFQSMMADAADEHEYLFGARREGLYFAGITLSAKASSGIGAWIAGVTLDLIGFPHGAAARGALTVPIETIRHLGLAQGPGAALFTAVAIAVLFRYKLNRADHQRIRGLLDQRRAEAALTH